MSNRRKAIATAPCDDCGTPTIRRRGPCEFYMVHDHVWQAAGMPTEPAYPGAGTGCLCIGCLELRLGRTLTAADFTDAELNDPERTRMTPRLLYRIGDFTGHAPVA